MNTITSIKPTYWHTFYLNNTPYVSLPLKHAQQVLATFHRSQIPAQVIPQKQFSYIFPNKGGTEKIKCILNECLLHRKTTDEIIQPQLCKPCPSLNDPCPPPQRSEAKIRSNLCRSRKDKASLSNELRRQLLDQLAFILKDPNSDGFSGSNSEKYGLLSQKDLSHWVKAMKTLKILLISSNDDFELVVDCNKCSKFDLKDSFAPIREINRHLAIKKINIHHAAKQFSDDLDSLELLCPSMECCSFFNSEITWLPNFISNQAKSVVFNSCNSLTTTKLEHALNVTFENCLSLREFTAPRAERVTCSNCPGLVTFSAPNARIIQLPDAMKKPKIWSKFFYFNP